MNKIKNVILYTGCKFELIEQIFDLVDNKRSFIFNDVFGGSGVLSINASNHFKDATINYNEFGIETFNMIQYLKNTDPKKVILDIEYIMDFYNLNSVDNDAFLFFRKERNKIHSMGHSVALLDIILIRHSYSSTPRWSVRKGDFNNPFGGRTWDYKQSINDINRTFNMLQSVSLSNLDYQEFFRQNPVNNSIDYLDPPYLITKANYNRGWTECVELAFYAAIDERVSNGGEFILSNVIHHKGKVNHILINWMSKYSVIYVEKEYNLGRTSIKSNKTVEVIVTNLK